MIYLKYCWKMLNLKVKEDILKKLSKGNKKIGYLMCCFSDET